MYASEVDGTVLNFTVSGKLWRRSLVMQDEETKTLWSHILGRGMEGKHKGVRLEGIPSALTDWSSWKAEYPQTTVLAMSRTGREFVREFYKDPSRFVLGVSRAGQARAWPYTYLMKQPLVNDRFRDKPIIVYFDPKNGAGYIYDRVVDDKTLTFERRGDDVIDAETQSTWNLRRGEATDGELKGTKLKAHVAIPSFQKAWRAFYPKSEYWRP